MTNARTTIWLAAAVISLAGSPVLSATYFNDGGIHNLNYVIDYAMVDYMSPGMETTVNLNTGGRTGYLNAYEDSWINILGGEIIGGLFATQHAHLSVSGGSIGTDLKAVTDNPINITGGSIGNRLWVWGNTTYVNLQGGTIGNIFATDLSQVDIFGGSIQDYLMIDTAAQANFYGGSVGGAFRLDPFGILNIYGSDFAVDGVPVGYGELTSILDGMWYDETARHLTGTLAGGGLIDNDFYIGYDAKIALVPAPGAVLLGSIGLSFAGWKLRRRKEL